MRDYFEISINDSIFPDRLREIYDPPKVLYCLGNENLLKNLSVSVVGSRQCSEYGKECAYRLGEKLSTNNITVVSGMAMGIDSFAHKGGLQGKGSTIAIMASGIKGCYPPRNKALREEIAKNGLLISEHDGDYVPKKYDFPRRNRIISGITDTTVVIEAGEKSGSLITAECAMEQNRNVFALPGNITSQFSQGSNRLIKEGACPLINFNDIIHDLGIIPIEENSIKEILGKDEQLIYEKINKWGEVSKNYLIETTGFSSAQINGLLSVLEIKGLVRSSLGKIYIAK